MVNGLEFRQDASKFCVIVTDAPPHGIERKDDDYPHGDPGQEDCLKICRALSSKGVTVYPVGCEPNLTTRYQFGGDFLRSVARICNGVYIPISSANVLTDVIIYGARDLLNIEKQLSKNGTLLEQFKMTDVPLEEQVYQLAQNVDMTRVFTLNTFDESLSLVSKENIDILISAESLSRAKPLLKAQDRSRTISSFHPSNITELTSLSSDNTLTMDYARRLVSMSHSRGYSSNSNTL